ncbi:hypothetical protein BC827DRAFT_550205 [Russula dissimulans]|nr:hypothetical protein BC827DRAFT_550205 [Russula dissimulans]
MLHHDGGQYGGRSYSGPPPQSYEYNQQPQPIQDRYRGQQSYEYYQQPQPVQDQYRGQRSYEGYQQQPQPIQDQYQRQRSYEGYQQEPQPIPGAQSYEYYQRQPQPIQRKSSGQQQQYVSTPYTANVPSLQPSPYAAPAVLQPAPPQQSVHRPPRTQTPHQGADVRRRASFSGEKPLRSAMNRMDSLARTPTNSSTRVDPGAPALVSLAEIHFMRALLFYPLFFCPPVCPFHVKTTCSCQ